MFSSTTTELSIRRDKHQRQSAQHHRVDGAAEGVKQQERGQAGDGNREAARRSLPRIDAQEDEDHQRGQAKTDAAFVQHVRNRGLHVFRLIEDDRRDQDLGNIEQVLARVRECH